MCIYEIRRRCIGFPQLMTDSADEAQVGGMMIKTGGGSPGWLIWERSRNIRETGP